MTAGEVGVSFFNPTGVATLRPAVDAVQRAGLARLHRAERGSVSDRYPEWAETACGLGSPKSNRARPKATRALPLGAAHHGYASVAPG